MKKIPTLKDLDLKEKKVLLRVDYNVPLNEKGEITDDTRVRATFPTLNYLLEKRAKIILLAHLGRPKGKPKPEYSLKPVARKLSELLRKEIKFAPCCVGEETKKMVEELNPGEILLLENLRFHPEERANDQSFAQTLASYGEVFIQEAFGTVHRAHASTASLPKLLPSACGFLLEKEIKYLSQLLENPERPFIAILGGAKVSDKIGVINNLLEKVDAFLIGGGMAYTFLKAEQIEVGDSLVEEEKLEVAREIKRKAAEKGVKILLPLDHLVAQEITPEAEVKETEGIKILPGWKGVDIGSTTQKTYLSLVKEAKTVLWNGPLGVFEIGQFAQGSLIIAKHLAEISQEGATVVIGGGDTIALVTKAGVKDKLTHLSTGGGALLEFLEGKELPGIKALIPE